MSFFDAHFHLVPSLEQGSSDDILSFYRVDNYAISCAHSPEEFERQDSFIKNNFLENKILQSYGIHPQLPLISNAQYLENLLKLKRIKFIGETGLDFFSEEYRQKRNEQIDVFNLCLDLAVDYNVPIVIHNRKAFDEMFKAMNRLRKVPLVLFHSFAFSSREALTILKHDVNGVFSFSKQILNGNKKSISCVSDLPLDRIFMETDAPFQTLKNEKITLPSEIKRVYEEGAVLRKMSLESFCVEIRDSSKKLLFCF